MNLERIPSFILAYPDGSDTPAAWSRSRKWFPGETVMIKEYPSKRYKTIGLPEYKKWHAEAGHMVNHHEFIPDNAPRKLVFDVDGSHNDLSRSIDDLKFAIAEVFADRFEVEPEILVASRNRPGKQSYHVIVLGFCFMKADCILLWKEITAMVPHVPADPAAKAPATLSIIGCEHKGHLLVAEDPKYEIGDYLLSDTGGCKFVELEMSDKNAEVFMPSLDEAEVREFAALIPHIADHKFHRQTGNFTNYVRVRPGFCRICNETHDKDNTLYLVQIGGDVFEGCTHMNPKYCKTCNQAQKASCSHKRAERILLGKCKQDDIERLIAAHKPMEPVLQQTRLPALQLKPANIKAPMACGKTHQLIALIRNMNPKTRILVVSTRLSFTASLMARLGGLGFQSYTDIKGAIGMDVRRVVLQVESLHRLNWEHDKIDLLVLDESETIVQQLMAPTVRHKRNTYNILASLLSNAVSPILMDANMNQSTLELYEEMGLPHSEMQVVAPQPRAAEMVVYKSKDLLMDKLFKLIELGKNVSIAHLGGVTEMNSLKALLIREYPDLKVQLINSETLKSEKEAWFKAPTKPDVLIYSPSAGPGVDIVYETAWFDVQFGFLNNCSCDVNYTRQMMRRVRQIKDSQMHVHFDIQQQYLPTSISGILAKVMARASAFPGYLECDNGRVILPNIGFNKLMLQGMLTKNVSAMHFVAMFITDEIKANPAVCISYVKKSELKLTRVKELKQQNEITKKDANNELADAADLDDAKYVELQRKVEKHDEVTRAEFLSLKKHNFKLNFGVPITVEFLTAFTKEIRRNYYNVKHFDSLNDEKALRQCCEDVEGSRSEMQVLLETKELRKKLCRQALLVLGNGGSKADMLRKLTDLLTPQYLKQVGLEFDKRPLKKMELNTMIRFVNPLIEGMFGYSYNTTDKNRTHYARNWSLSGLVNTQAGISNGKFIMPTLQEFAT